MSRQASNHDRSREIASIRENTLRSQKWDVPSVSHSGNKMGLGRTIVVRVTNEPESDAHDEVRMTGAFNRHTRRSLPSCCGTVLIAIALLPVGIIVPMRVSAVAQPQTRPTEMAFEVASIKPNRSGSRSFGTRKNPGGRFIANNETLAQLIDVAYAQGDFWRILAGQSSRITGGPRWVYSERYDVNASAGREVTVEEMRAMVRALLTERFKLVARHETRSQPTYALMIARPAGRSLGPQLRRIDVDCAAVAADRAAALRNGTSLPPPASNGAPLCGAMANDGELKFGGVTTDVLAMRISKEAGRTVVDKTGLRGTYEVTLRYSPAGNNSASDDRPTLFMALREQLGLELVPQQNAIDFMVIDRAERPTPN